MAKTCIQCGTKIGMFQKAVDGIYCSLECSAKAQKEIAEAEAKRTVQRAEAEKRAAEEAKAAAVRKADEKAAAKTRGLCPKCGAPWTYQPAPDASGMYAGNCTRCAYSVTFLDVEKCPSCSGMSLVVESATSARCPRCKYRRE
jgi:nucleoid-associated protein YgaU